MFGGKRGAAKCFILQLPLKNRLRATSGARVSYFIDAKPWFFQFPPINSRYAVRSDDHMETGRFFHPN